MAITIWLCSSYVNVGIKRVHFFALQHIAYWAPTHPQRRSRDLFRLQSQMCLRDRFQYSSEPNEVFNPLPTEHWIYRRDRPASKCSDRRCRKIEPGCSSCRQWEAARGLGRTGMFAMHRSVGYRTRYCMQVAFDHQRIGRHSLHRRRLNGT